MAFSDKLRQLRNENNLTQVELAKSIGISDRTIIRYEAGVVEPPLSTLIAIAEFFKTNTDFLLGLSNVRERSG